MLGKELQNSEVNVLHEQHAIAAGNRQPQVREGEGRHAVMVQRLDELNNCVAALQTAIRQAVAEADYARHRAETDLTHASKYGIEAFAKDLLPFKDALEAALAVETSDTNAHLTGLQLSLKLLQTALEKNGLFEISPCSGAQFDWEKHRPLVRLGAEDEMRTIVCTEQKGYEIHGRVPRPALVTLR